MPCLDNYADTVQRNLKCPECRAEHTIDPYEGVKSLPTNLTLSAFLDIHMEATEENAAQFEAYIQRYLIFLNFIMFNKDIIWNGVKFVMKKRN